MGIARQGNIVLLWLIFLLYFLVVLCERDTGANTNAIAIAKIGLRMVVSDL